MQWASADYGKSVPHRRRLQVLTDAGPDPITFETIPNQLEGHGFH
jgi:S-methylmethionine-dependent homocysteine/selenocysteine methylase